MNAAVIITLLEQQINVAAGGLLHTAVKKSSIAVIAVTVVRLVRPASGERPANGANRIDTRGAAATQATGSPEITIAEDDMFLSEFEREDFSTCPAGTSIQAYKEANRVILIGTIQETS